MKTRSMLILLAGLAINLMASCNTKTEVKPVVDQRDQHVGVYACEVRIENFNTKQLFSTYLDTLELSKQGERELVVKSMKTTPIPLLQVLPPNAYYGEFTVLTIRRDTLSLASGPDARFYEYVGHKLR